MAGCASAGCEQLGWAVGRRTTLKDSHNSLGGCEPSPLMGNSRCVEPTTAVPSEGEAMTIAIALKIGDGLVLGADSASTLSGATGTMKVYFNAEKVFNLRKDWPIGAVTYGLGNLDNRSVHAVAKDLREKFTTKHHPWQLNRDTYSVSAVVDRMIEFFYDGLYKKEWPQSRSQPDGSALLEYQPMGFMVGGYSAGEREAEVWEIWIDTAGMCTKKMLFGIGQYGLKSRGQPEAINRLVNGYSFNILSGLVGLGVDEAQAKQFLEGQGIVPIVQRAMPLQDAIDLVKYLCEVTAGFVRFIPGDLSVHEPIDIAALSLHEGFRWVCRKHYFDRGLNPRMGVG